VKTLNGEQQHRNALCYPPRSLANLLEVIVILNLFKQYQVPDLVSHTHKISFHF